MWESYLQSGNLQPLLRTSQTRNQQMFCLSSKEPNVPDLNGIPLPTMYDDKWLSKYRNVPSLIVFYLKKMNSIQECAHTPDAPNACLYILYSCWMAKCVMPAHRDMFKVTYSYSEQLVVPFTTCLDNYQVQVHRMCCVASECTHNCTHHLKNDLDFAMHSSRTRPSEVANKTKPRAQRFSRSFYFLLTIICV